MMEFGVRGIANIPGKPTIQPGYCGGRHAEIWRTNIAAFQQLWFDIASAQLGYSGDSQVGRLLGPVRPHRRTASRTG